MDDFEKNNDLENEAEDREMPEENVTATDEVAEAAEKPETEVAQEAAEKPETEAAQETAEEFETEAVQEAVEAQEAEEAPEADEAEESAEICEGVSEDDIFFSDDNDPMLAGGDLQPCEDISDEAAQDEQEETPEEENIEDIPEEELCKRCFSRRRDDSVEGFEYCSVCVEEMAKTTLSFGAFFYIVLSTVVFMLTVVFVIAGVYIAKPVVKAESLAKQHRLTQAIQQFDDAEERAEKANSFKSGLLGKMEKAVEFETGTNTALRYIRMVSELVGPPNAGKAMESMESINVEKLPANMKAIYDEYKKFYDTYDLVSEAFQEFYNSAEDAEPDYNKMIEKIDQIAQENEDVYKPAMEYFKYSLAINSGAPEEIQLSYLNKLEKDYPDTVWLYLTPLMETHFKAGDYEKAIAYCDKILEINLNDTLAMKYKVRAYYNMDKKDKVEETIKIIEQNSADASSAAMINAELKRRDGKFDETIALCDDVIAKDPTPEEPYRQKAIAQMLKGDMKGAHETLKEGYDAADISFDLIELLAITSNKTEDKDMIQQIDSMLSYYGHALSPKTQSCINGELTVEQIFMEGAGDVI